MEGQEVPMLLFALACTLPHPEIRPAELPAATDPRAVDWDAPGPITAEVVVSARWEVPRSGILDLTDPQVAGLADEPVPIVLPVVHLLHPTAGAVVIDTGVDADLAAGGAGPVRAPLASYLATAEPVEALGSIVGDQPLSLVLLTHAHADHVLGLPDVPASVPVVVGPHELDGRSLMNLAVGRTVGAALAGHDLRELSPESAVTLDLAGRPATGWDLLGDGSLWAIAAPGHTAGSLAFVARTTEGPLLVTGDTSHTRWGWDHDVAPGTYTEDPAAGRATFELLRGFAAAHPTMRIQVGHEIDPQVR